MTIPIPEELAKRVLEALEEHCDDMRNATSAIVEMYGRCNRRAERAFREEAEACKTRDELAALLAPREAT